MKKFTFIMLVALLGTALLTACQPQTVVKTVVVTQEVPMEKTVVVTQEVPVEKTVVVTQEVPTKKTVIEFWTTDNEEERVNT